MARFAYTARDRTGKTITSDLKLRAVVSPRLPLQVQRLERTRGRVNSRQQR